MNLRELGAIQLDGLKEVANIGACHAATSLSELTGEKIMVNVPQIKIVSIEEVPSLLGEPEEIMASILVYFLGDMTGTTLLVFPKAAAFHLVDSLLKREIGTTTNLTEIEESCLKEAANILTCSYMNALGDFLGLLIIPSVPSLAVDMVAAVFDTVSLNFSQDKDFVVCIETEFRFIEVGTILKGYFLLMPDPDSLGIVLKAIHLG
ncbi:MAG: chemotaxis protein CheC [Candidatus Edwardsbacteria bacterium]